MFCSCGDRHRGETHVNDNDLGPYDFVDLTRLWCTHNNLRQPKSNDLLVMRTSGTYCVISNASDTRGEDLVFMTFFFLSSNYFLFPKFYLVRHLPLTTVCY